MTIKVGDQIPSMKLMMGTPEGPKETSTDEIFKGKKVVLFAVPGAFTPTCSAKHLPGFVQNIDAMKAKGVDTVACIAVNDAFVMAAWGKEQGTDGKVTMLADRFRGVRQGARAGIGPDGPRHGHAQPALCPGRAGRQGDAPRRRGTWRLRGQQGRVDPGSPVVRRNHHQDTKGTQGLVPACPWHLGAHTGCGVPT